MTVERGLRLIAGGMVLLSLALTCYASHCWMWLTVFIGLNLLQIGVYKLVSSDGHPSRHWPEGLLPQR